MRYLIFLLIPTLSFGQVSTKEVLHLYRNVADDKAVFQTLSEKGFTKYQIVKGEIRDNYGSEYKGVKTEDIDIYHKPSGIVLSYKTANDSLAQSWSVDFQQLGFECFTNKDEPNNIYYFKSGLLAMIQKAEGGYALYLRNFNRRKG